MSFHSKNNYRIKLYLFTRLFLSVIFTGTLYEMWVSLFDYIHLCIYFISEISLKNCINVTENSTFCNAYIFTLIVDYIRQLKKKKYIYDRDIKLSYRGSDSGFIFTLSFIQVIDMGLSPIASHFSLVLWFFFTVSAVNLDMKCAATEKLWKK